MTLNRRKALILIGSAALVPPGAARAKERPAIHVVKGTGCECCEAWVAYLRDQGFAVTDEERFGTLLIGFIYVALNLLADVLYRVMDPRVR